MKRLTHKDDRGNWQVKGLPWEKLHEGGGDHRGDTGEAVWLPVQAEGL